MAATGIHSLSPAGSPVSRSAAARPRKSIVVDRGPMIFIAIFAVIGLLFTMIGTVKLFWPEPKTCTTDYTVQAGDSWYLIAKKQGDPSKTVWVNAGASAALSYNQTPDLVLAQPLKVGEELTVYCGGPLPDNVIKPG